MLADEVLTLYFMQFHSHCLLGSCTEFHVEKRILCKMQEELSWILPDLEMSENKHRGNPSATGSVETEQPSASSSSLYEAQANQIGAILGEGPGF